MRTVDKTLPEDNRSLELEIVTQAEEVLGAIPDWYLFNKAIIEHNRNEVAEITSSLVTRLEIIARYFKISHEELSRQKALMN